jgi:SAM-dependent methyltransferase
VTAPPAAGRFRCVRCGGDAILSSKGDPPRCSSCQKTYSNADGIVALTETADDRDYPAALVDLVASVERRHFWFTARNDVILWTIRRVMGTVAGLRVLDIGCGTGFVTEALERAGMDAWGIDMHRAALLHARSRIRGPLFSNDATTLPFFRDFDLASLFDVIEHLDDDVSAVREAVTAVKPHGCVVVTVPAGQHLWTRYDEVIGHKRRYDRQGLTGVLASAGLETLYAGYFSCLPLLAQTVQRWLAPGMRSESSDMIEIVRQTLTVPPEPLNALFRASVRAEAPLRQLPWMRGGSLIAVARRAD